MIETKKVYRAGMICYRVLAEKQAPDDIVMLFMVPSDPSYGTDLPQIPKGRLEEGETAQEAAVRETREEVGLFKGNIIKGPNEVGVFMGRTTVFVCKIKEDSLFGEPSFETAETKWMTLDQFLTEGRDLHRPVVKAVYREILRMENRKDQDE